ncbi:MAG: 1-acyl-sn-glycerol-3-phosphate acyltransferase [Anaerolineales bacterium]|nr:1-acyl-sn-glycerol-3-phosphate acyltransferase [Anaerolineales bacterium]MCB9127242.1 1-acyl-sn-glycerol-3-phosphate acyltransferase [Ardenticatenales bacterium]MCB9172929.1 1-acyl-sn-glycerol-3-phosphate acyltransferase [Ardenticatenales bacterium]
MSEAALYRRRKLLLVAARLIVRTLARVDYRHLDRLPSGPAILAPNHLGHADPLLLAAALAVPPDVVALSDLAHERVAPLVRYYRPFLVHRDLYDRTVLRQARGALRRGNQLVIFPEARISVTGALEPARDGVGYLALLCDVPLIPIAITGTERAWQTLRSGRRPALTLTVGDPLYPRDAPTAPRREQRTWLTTTLMQRIAALLPAAYRGVYSDWREGE